MLIANTKTRSEGPSVSLDRPLALPLANYNFDVVNSGGGSGPNPRVDSWPRYGLGVALQWHAGRTMIECEGLLARAQMSRAPDVCGRVGWCIAS
jgi:hypothetical protein